MLGEVATAFLGVDCVTWAKVALKDVTSKTSSSWTVLGSTLR